MIEFANELIGRKCRIETVNDYTHDGIINRVFENWLEINDDTENEQVFINFKHIIEISFPNDEEAEKKTSKRVLFGKRKEEEF